LYESRGEMQEDRDEDGWETTGPGDDGEEAAEAADQSAASIFDGDRGAETDADPVPAAEGSAKAHDLLARSRRLLGQMHEDDREEAIDLNEQIEAALISGDIELNHALQALGELLFFVEGHEASPRKAE
jgi:hypothetical protein